MIPLRPKITTTTTQRDYLDGSLPTSYSHVETEYALWDGDIVLLSVDSLTVIRGNRYNDGEQYTLRIGEYTRDLMRKAILALVHEMKRRAEDNSSEFCQNRAISFLADLRSALD